MSKHPEVLWAQRSSKTVPEKNIVYLTINLPDIIESSVEYVLTSIGLSFKATAGTNAEQSQYAFELNFFEEIDPGKSTKRLTSRSFGAVLRKKETKSEYWPRLTKDKVKTPYIKTDFSKWADEDEQDGKPDPDEGGFGEFGGGGGFPGMGSDFSGMGGDFDFSKMPSDLGGGSAATRDIAVEAESDDDDDEDGDDGPPPLEDAEPAK